METLPLRQALPMRLTAALLVSLVALPGLVCTSGFAQAQPAAPGASAATAAATGAASGLRVIEDDNVRIEETRVRGQLTRVVVHDKTGDKPRSYEILVGRGGRDPSQDKGAAGQRVWSILRF